MVKALEPHIDPVTDPKFAALLGQTLVFVI
jgi:hypothetical protein